MKIVRVIIDIRSHNLNSPHLSVMTKSKHYFSNYVIAAFQQTPKNYKRIFVIRHLRFLKIVLFRLRLKQKLYKIALS